MIVQRVVTVSLLLLVAALSTALGAAVRRQASSECLYEFVTQPPAQILGVCNPFEQQNSLTLKCSILVSDSTPGEVTVEWMFKEQLSNREIVLHSTTTAHSQGDTITSIFTVPETDMGEYYCQPTSSIVGQLNTSTKTEILNRALYFGGRTCTGLEVSTEQSQCAQENIENEAPTTPGTQPETTQPETTQPSQTNSTTSAPRPTTPTSGCSNCTTDPPSLTLYMALGGMGVVILFLVFCVIALASCYYKRTNRRNRPKTKGHGSRVVRDWHAVIRTDLTELDQSTPRYSRAHYVVSAPLHPPRIRPPVLASTEPGANARSQELTSSQQYNDYSSNWIPSYKDDRSEWMQSKRTSSASLRVTNRVSVERVLSNDSTQAPATLESSAGTERHSYVNCPQANASLSDINRELVQEGRNVTTSMKDPEDMRSVLRGQSSSQEDVAYSVVGSLGHNLYQELIPQTMDYLSLYHTVDKAGKGDS